MQKTVLIYQDKIVENKNDCGIPSGNDTKSTACAVNQSVFDCSEPTLCNLHDGELCLQEEELCSHEQHSGVRFLPSHPFAPVETHPKVEAFPDLPLCISPLSRFRIILLYAWTDVIFPYDTISLFVGSADIQEPPICQKPCSAQYSRLLWRLCHPESFENQGDCLRNICGKVHHKLS